VKKSYRQIFLVFISILLVSGTVFNLTVLTTAAPAYPDIYQVEYGQPVLDGDIDDIWEDAFCFDSFKGALDARVVANKDSKGSLKLLWDDKGLYVLAQITDPTMLGSYAGIEWYNSDGVSYFVKEDSLKNGDSTFDVSENPSAPNFADSGVQLRRLAVGPNGAFLQDFGNSEWYDYSDQGDSNKVKNPNLVSPPTTVVGYKKSADGYVVEGYIPFKTEKTGGELIKFEAQLTSYYDGARKNFQFLSSKDKNLGMYGQTEFAKLVLSDTYRPVPDPTKPKIGSRPDQSPLSFDITFGTPKMDGKGSDSVWNNADWHLPVGTAEENSSGMQAPYASGQKVKFLWDPEFIYILAKVENDPHCSADADYYMGTNEKGEPNTYARSYTADGVSMAMWDIDSDNLSIKSVVEAPCVRSEGNVGAYYNNANFIGPSEEAFKFNVDTEGKSYTIEFKVPFSDLRKNDDKIKLDLNFSDWNPEVEWSEFHDKRSFTVMLSNPLYQPWSGDNPYLGAADITLKGLPENYVRPGIESNAVILTVGLNYTYTPPKISEPEPEDAVALSPSDNTQTDNNTQGAESNTGNDIVNQTVTSGENTEPEPEETAYDSEFWDDGDSPQETVKRIIKKTSSKNSGISPFLLPIIAFNVLLVAGVFIFVIKKRRGV